MNKKQRMKEGKGFIAALDQSGGSTPKALSLYGVSEDSYKNEDEMFSLIHDMRSRIITSPAFTDQRILAAILFEQTMDRQVEGLYTADYLLKKGILPILKTDKGLEELQDGVQLMKPFPELDQLLDRAVERNIFGTKMRSVIKEYNEEGIKAVVKQQFEIGKQILSKGLVPILEPEVDIHAEEKEMIESYLLQELLRGLDNLAEEDQVMFKLTLPTQKNLYQELVNHPKVLRVVALSGGYSREEANAHLAQNPGVIASFSRALTEGLHVSMDEETFNDALDTSTMSIYQASIT